MKRLAIIGRQAASFFINAPHAIITNLSSLLTWIKMLLNVGFVIIMAAVFVALLDVLVRIHNYRNGTEFQTISILRDLIGRFLDYRGSKKSRSWNYPKNL